MVKSTCSWPNSLGNMVCVSRRLVAAVEEGDAELVAALVPGVRDLHCKIDGVNIFKLAK